MRPGERLALVGFSQGTMMALDRTMRRGDAAAVVGFSGMVADPAAALPKAARHPPILLVHGTADPVLPFASLGAAEHALATAGFQVEALERPGLGHGIDQEGATRAVHFRIRFTFIRQASGCDSNSLVARACSFHRSTFTPKTRSQNPSASSPTPSARL